MKISYWAALVFGLLVLCNSTAYAIKISGKIIGEKVDTVYLWYYFSSHSTPVAISKVVNNTFELRVPKEYSKGIFSIGINNPGQNGLDFESGYSHILLEDKNIMVEWYSNKKGNQQLNVLNSPATAEYNTYDSTIEALNSRKNSLIMQANKDIQTATNESESQNLYRYWIAKLDSVQVATMNWLNTFAYLHKTTPSGKIADALSRMAGDTSQYFSKEDFEDMYLASETNLERKLMLYFYSGKAGREITGSEFILSVLKKAPPKSRSRIGIYYIGFKNFQEQIDEIRPLLVSWIAEFPNDKWGKTILAKLPKAAPRIGDLAPDIKLLGVDGDTLKLSSLRGKVVLLDFWASWCGPCRKENPNVVRAYDAYNSKGFTIFSVSLDQDGGKWKEAIKKDNLKWSNHVSDLRGWSSAGAALYSVRSIPATFLIDKNGRIVDKDLRGEKLEEKLKSLLN